MGWRDYLVTSRTMPSETEQPSTLPIEPSERLTPQAGDIVTWQSPLFGELRGRVLMAEASNHPLVVDHPVTGMFTYIAAGWITKVEMED